LSNGSYYLYATLSSGGKTYTKTLGKTLVISHPNSPTVTLTDLSTGDKIRLTSAARNIEWTASDPDGDTLSFDLEYRTDSGSSWTSIATGQGDSPYSWTPTGLAEGVTYQLRITASDSGGLTGMDLSDEFGIATETTHFARVQTILLDKCKSCHVTGGNLGDFNANLGYTASLGAQPIGKKQDEKRYGNTCRRVWVCAWPEYEATYKASAGEIQGLA